MSAQARKKPKNKNYYTVKNRAVREYRALLEELAASGSLSPDQEKRFSSILITEMPKKRGPKPRKGGET